MIPTASFRMNTPATAAWNLARTWAQRRLPAPGVVVPLDEHGRRGMPREVRIIALDERSFVFEHDSSLTNRRALVRVDDRLLGPFEAEVDLRWCRFEAGSGYASGGRFLRVLKRPA
ncbi:hypothetical protein OAS39_08930 [Pirellulales bacterium]|nr:hypothetical protein [Pirellulales bacterium]